MGQDCTLPLGRLLNALAEAAHLTLRSEASADGKTRTYRLSRSKGLRDEIASHLDTKRAAEMAQVEWQWDALARLGSLPADKQQEAAENAPSIGDALPLAKLVAALGPEGKSTVMSGEPLSVDSTTSPHGALVREWFRAKSRGMEVAREWSRTKSREIEMVRAQAGDTHRWPAASPERLVSGRVPGDTRDRGPKPCDADVRLPGLVVDGAIGRGSIPL